MFNPYEVTRKPLLGGIRFLDNLIIDGNFLVFGLRHCAIVLIILYLFTENIQSTQYLLTFIIIALSFFFLWYVSLYVYSNSTGYPLVYGLLLMLNSILIYIDNHNTLVETNKVVEFYLILNNLFFLLLSYYTISKEKIIVYVLLFTKCDAKDLLYYRLLAFTKGNKFFDNNSMNDEIKYCLEEIKNACRYNDMCKSRNLELLIDRFLYSRQQYLDNISILSGSISVADKHVIKKNIEIVSVPQPISVLHIHNRADADNFIRVVDRMIIKDNTGYNFDQDILEDESSDDDSFY